MPMNKEEVDSLGKRVKAENKKSANTEEQEVFETAEEFNEAAEAYFNEADKEGKLYGEAGLCIGLSRYNKKGRNVGISTLRSWYDKGLESCPGLQEAVQMAYLRIQEQIETDPAYVGKGGMTTKAIFLLKQSRLGGYQEKQEAKGDMTLNITFGKNMDKSDFE